MGENFRSEKYVSELEKSLKMLEEKNTIKLLSCAVLLWDTCCIEA